VPVDEIEDFRGKYRSKSFVIKFKGSSSEAGSLTYPGPDGQPRTVAIPVTGGGPISLDVGTGTVTTSAAPSPRGSLGSGVPAGLRSPTLMGGLNYTTLTVPRAGYGVSDIGNSNGESFIDRIGGKVNYVGYGGDALFPVGQFIVGLGFHGGSGTSRDSGQLAAGGEPGGIVFIDDSQEFGTGLNFGSNGVDLDGWTNISQHGFYGKFGLPIPCDNGKSSIMPYVKLSYTQIDVRQRVSYSTPAFPGQIGSTVEHDLENNRLSVGLGGYYNHFLSEKFAIGVNLEGSVHFNDRKLTSMQEIDLFGTLDTVNVRDDDKDTSFGALAELSGTYYVTPNFGFNLYARYRYDDDLGRVENPLSGNDILAGESARIGSGSTDEFSVGARVIFTFGSRTQF
jgi:hypothetical protein